VPFDKDEPPTKPEGPRALLRLLSERVLALSAADVAVLAHLHAEALRAGPGSAERERYRAACEMFVDMILG
jgi:hypothetical protein